MKKSLIALAFGTLGLGIAEFTMMGILPYVAADLNISIPVAGHFISAYALGVCTGAPILILARKHPLKRILLVLMALMLIGNLGASLASGYWMLLAARFISGLPHGAYFGVASIVAGKLADKGKNSEAVSIMIAGMTVANLFGVPLGTSLSHLISWRIPFLLVGCWGMIVLYYIWRWVPDVEGLEDTGFKGQFRFLRNPAPWLILGATALGNGGVFCWYRYINPFLTKVSGYIVESLTDLRGLAGQGRYGCTRNDMCHSAVDFLPFSLSVAFSIIDGLVYSRTFCRIQSGTSADNPCSAGRRNVGRCLCTGGFQSGQCHRGLCRRYSGQRRLQLTGIGRGTFCTGRFRLIFHLL